MILPQNIKVLQVSENMLGRDIFVGDIHGYYDTFLKGLEALGFNSEIDRVFSVGDLIDRGPDSLACLRLLNNDWFFSCIGNHEQLFYKKIFTSNNKINISAKWQRNLSNSEVEECYSLIHKMHLAISIKNTKNTIGVVHAGVPFKYSWNQFIDELNAKHVKTIAFALSDRNVTHQKQTISGVDHVFIGHQGLDCIKFFGNQICIDTAVFVENLSDERYGLSFSWLDGDKPVFMTQPVSF